jgi:hypothetical protein
MIPPISLVHAQSIAHYAPIKGKELVLRPLFAISMSLTAIAA